jgi:hypothetical protein
MARDNHERASHDAAHRQQLEAEWANVGLCGGMYRPIRANGHQSDAPADEVEQRADAPAPRPVNADDWPPHNRCCG